MERAEEEHGARPAPSGSRLFLWFRRVRFHTRAHNMDAGFFKGTSSEQDTRFSDKQSKLLKSLKFPPEFDKKVRVIVRAVLPAHRALTVSPLLLRWFLWVSMILAGA